jgi:hypothetical protein
VIVGGSETDEGVSGGNEGVDSRDDRKERAEPSNDSNVAVGFSSRNLSTMSRISVFDNPEPCEFGGDGAGEDDEVGDPAE